MGWISICGEFIGSASAAFVKTKAKLEQQEVCKATDFCPDETKHFIAKSLAECAPSNIDLTRWGRITTEHNLKKNLYFGSLLAIDANTKPGRRSLCILALKTAAKCICYGYDEDMIRTVTYSYLAANYLD